MVTTTTGIATSFIQFSRASNATVTNNVGNIAWAGHNLLTNSESFDASAWTKGAITSTNPSVVANAGIAPNGTTTADRVNYGAIDAAGDVSTVSQLLTLDAATYTGGVWIKAVAAGDVGKTVSVYLNDGSIRGQVFVTVTADWQYVTTSAALTGGASRQFQIATVGSDFGGANQAAVSVYLWGAHLYRSDLGGMVFNPAMPAGMGTYYPTTPRNLLGYTEDFNSWTKTNATIGVDAIVAPNGLKTADALTASSTGVQVATSQNSAFAVGAPNTFSVYAKAGTSAFLQIIPSNAVISGGFANFNLSSGVVGSNAGSGLTSSITAVGDGWYRCSITLTAAATGAIQINMTNSATSARAEVFSGAAGSILYLWGAQLSNSASIDPYTPVYGAAVTSAAYYAPRLDYSPTTIQPLGLLVEEQRTNLALRSQEFDVGWSASGVTLTPNAIASPDGTVNAEKIITDNAASGGNITLIPTLSANTTYTWSVFAKKGEWNWIVLTLQDEAATPLRAWFNLNTGTIGTVEAGATATITGFGNGWYRCTMTRTLGATVGAPRNRIAPTNADNALSTGDGASGVYIWGAQLEAGSFATSYIPTGSATATHAADVASVSTQAFPYSASESTLVAAFTNFDTDGSCTIAHLDGSATGNGLLIFQLSGGTTMSAYVAASNVSLGAATLGATQKIGLAYNGTDNGAVRNGGSVSSVGTTYTDTVDRLLLGGNYAGNAAFLNGHIRQITYIPRRLTNAELQTRTT